jgi:crossover junction endodeoxyribonuclease RusA
VQNMQKGGRQMTMIKTVGIPGIKIVIFGVPVPQGSTRAFIPKGWNRPIITSDNPKTKPWRQEIAGAAAEAMGRSLPAECAIGVRCEFYFCRPKSTKKSVLQKLTKPDVDKLCRSVLDALTGVAFGDDSQVVALMATKKFSAQPRAEITVEFLEECP